MKYIVYSKPNCTHCDQAKALLDAKELPYDVLNLDVGQERVADEVYISRDTLLSLIPTARTMPQIMKHDENGVRLIGGFAELKRELDAAS